MDEVGNQPKTTSGKGSSEVLSFTMKLRDTEIYKQKMLKSFRRYLNMVTLRKHNIFLWNQVRDSILGNDVLYLETGILAAKNETQLHKVTYSIYLITDIISAQKDIR